MKKIIILAMATLSTGIVLSSSMKKNEVIKPVVSVDVQKSMVGHNKNIASPSYDALATAD